MEKKLLVMSGLLSMTVIGILAGVQQGSQASASEIVAPAPVQIQATPVAFTDLGSGTQSKVTSRVNYLITSQVELSQLWDMLGTNSEVPSIDFSKNDVIAVFAGNEPTAGYTIAVTAVSDASNRMINITLTKPGGSCLLAQSITTPYDVVSLPKSALALSHTDHISTVSCLQ